MLRSSGLKHKLISFSNPFKPYSMINKFPQIVDGKSLSINLNKKMKDFVEKNMELGIRQPGFAVIEIGNREDSAFFIKQKLKMCENIGIKTLNPILAPDASKQNILDLIDDLNKREDIDGIIAQLPFPDHLTTSETEITNRIDPFKDVDGLCEKNISKFALDETPVFLPPLVESVQLILRDRNISVEGLHATVLGPTQLLGLPMASILSTKKATVTIVGKESLNTDIQKLISIADVLISEVGKPGIIDPAWVKEGCLLFDASYNYTTENGKAKVTGDVELEKVVEKCGLITPVPGGLGPMSLSMLMFNIIKSWAIRLKIDSFKL